MICDKELLVGYLYDELTRSEQDEFDRHLRQCRECRDEVNELRATRTHLATWRPPEPDLNFEIVRRPAAAAAPAASRWSISPAWGLAAAAVLVLAAASAIANLEVRAGRDGIVVRTGWNHGVDNTAAGAAGTSSESTNADSAAEVQTILQRLTELESQVSSERQSRELVSERRSREVVGERRSRELVGDRQSRDSVMASADTSSSGQAGTRLSDAEILKRVRDIVAESEKRQESMVATRVVRSMRELEAAYRAELVRLQQGINQNQGLRDAEVYRQREMLNQVYRLVGQQR